MFLILTLTRCMLIQNAEGKTENDGPMKEKSGQFSSDYTETKTIT